MNTQKALRTLVAIGIFASVAWTLSRPAGAQEAPGDDPAAAARILELVNRDRVQAGLAPLAARADVTAVAAAWSASMAEAQVLSHSDDYFSPESRERLSAKSLAENVARNGSVDDTHARLMASPGHRANIMSTSFTVVGIAVFRDARGTYWVTQDFLLPKAAAPAPPPATVPAPAAAPAPRPAAVTPVAASQAAPAPVAAPAPAPTEPPPPARATVDTAPIAAHESLAPATWDRPPPAPVAAAGPYLASGISPFVWFAGAANALVTVALVAGGRRRVPVVARAG